ncbi:MAG: 50S ribosomal protein L9 [Sulfurimonas sp.]
MKVLLIKEVKTLGKAGEIKEVKDGYGQNFLIGKGLAKLATPEVVKSWREEQERKAQELADELARLEAEKITLEAANIRIEKESAPVGIKGSVGNADISKAVLDQLNIELDKKQINLKKAIKTAGIHEVDAKLGQGIHAALKVEIIGV